MDEVGWKSGTDPQPMLELVSKEAGDRKLRLFAAACVRRVWGLLREVRSRRAVETAEEYADGRAGEEELLLAVLDARKVSEPAARSVWAARPPQGVLWWAGSATRACAGAVERAAAFAAVKVRRADVEPAMRAAWEQERQAQAALAREVFGNPFRSVALEPSWRTPDVRALAEAAYEERRLPDGTLEPARLAVLADALEDAGCTDADILGHLRGEGPHVRGCWAVDLLTGRE